MNDPTSDHVLASTHFKVTSADVTAANRTYLRWTARNGRTWAWILGFAALCALGYAIAMPGGRNPIVLTGVAGGMIAWLLAWYVILYAEIPLFAGRAMKTQPNLLHEWRVDLGAACAP